MAARKGGMSKLEADVEEPDKSQVFAKYPKFLKEHHAVHFLCDTLRMSISGGGGLVHSGRFAYGAGHRCRGAPEEIGHHVAAALVGTFLGILMCYGFLGPMASNLAKLNEGESQYYNFLRQGSIAFIRGAAPILAVEFARRSIPSHARPTFQEMEAACKGGAPAA
jgi:chemotaxis protein MotA